MSKGWDMKREQRNPENAIRLFFHPGTFLIPGTKI